jgi:tetratricopeptide (TPR) repeat protein
MSVRIFLSAVSDEFRSYRDQLRTDLTRHNVEVKVQEDFKNLGGDTLDKLDVYIAHCDAVVHIVGDMTGSEPGEREQRALLAKYPHLAGQLPPLGEALRDGVGVSYTQWEAWLALYHGKLLFMAEAEKTAIRGPNYIPTQSSRVAGAQHLERLQAVGRYAGCAFVSPDDLAKHIAYTGIFDLLVKDYAEEEVRGRAVAEGFIREMAKKVAGDRNLDFDGMKQEVRNAIETYEKELAGGQDQTNIDAIVDEALARARSLVDTGKSGLARAALRKAAGAMRKDEEERHEHYVLAMTALYNREREIALAGYDGVAAAEAMVALADAIHGANATSISKFLTSEAATFYKNGMDRGSNVHLVAAITLRRRLLLSAATGDERGRVANELAVSLGALGERESGTERLEEAIAILRAALGELTREHSPLKWVQTQNNLGNALRILGQRKSEKGLLEEAVAASLAALEVDDLRERHPSQWAIAQIGVGNALGALGELEGGTERLEPAVEAFRAAQEVYTRERFPPQWGMAQISLGNALRILGEREDGTGRLEEAVVAYGKALEEVTRERAPLPWATAQNNLGIALSKIGERESGTTRLDEAVAAYREALKEWTRERVPLQWATTQNNLGSALSTLGKRESGNSGTARLEEAVAAYLAALQERTRERVPLDWAGTQFNLGNALSTLGERENGMGRLEEAIAAYLAALQERTRERFPLEWAATHTNLGGALSTLGERESGTRRLEQAVATLRAALEVFTRRRFPRQWAATQNNLGNALSTLGEPESGTGRLEKAVATFRAALDGCKSGDGSALENWPKPLRCSS